MSIRQRIAEKTRVNIINSRNMRPIHHVFVSWLRDMIDEKAEQAINILAPTMQTWDMYRHLVPREKDRDELQCAAALLQPMKTFNEHGFKLNVHTLNIKEPVEFQLIMPVPKGWNAILMPAIEHCTTIGWGDGQTGLNNLIMPSLTAAQQWTTLRHVTLWLLDYVKDRAAIRDMFPWIGETIAEGKWQEYYGYRNLARDTKESCDKTFAHAVKLRQGYTPRMTPEIRQICQSGVKLFSQLRMLKLVEGDKFDRLQVRTIDSAALVPSMDKSLIPQSVHDDLAAIKDLR